MQLLFHSSLPRARFPPLSPASLWSEQKLHAAVEAGRGQHQPREKQRDLSATCWGKSFPQKMPSNVHFVDHLTVRELRPRSSVRTQVAVTGAGDP